MKSKIDAAKSKLKELQDRHAAALSSAQATLDRATQAKDAAYDLLLRARASGVADVSALQTAYEKANTGLQAARLDADTSRTVATMLEPQIEAAKAELSNAVAEYQAAKIEALKEAKRVEGERYARAQEEMINANIKSIVINNRLAKLLRAESGLYDLAYTPLSFDREALLTKGKLISRLEAEVETIGEG